MMPMETAPTQPPTKAAVAATIETAAEYGKLPPLNPDDLKPHPAAPSAASKMTDNSESMSLNEVWDEIKVKVREAIMGSSVSGILNAIRIANFVMAGLMITICLLEMINSDGFQGAVTSIMAVLYTM